MKKTLPLIITGIVIILLAPGLKQVFGITQVKDNHFNDTLPKTEVSFKTSDTTLQKVFDESEKRLKPTFREFGPYKVLGGDQIWLETQPNDGYMYAKRNLEIARNSIQIFMDLQREDGRLPAHINIKDNVFFPGMVNNFKNTNLNAAFGYLQGYFFPMPAFELYFWLKKDKKYLLQVYNTMEKFDDYLWKNRDSDNDGCLETWCVYDTGEDNCVRYGNSPSSWPFEKPPTVQELKEMSEQDLKRNCYTFVKLPEKNTFDSLVHVPMESMDVMSWSYSGRDALARISKELRNGKETYWRNKANDVRKKIKDYLWDQKRHACYDRDRSNKVMNVLLHNNIRCMFFGSFDQQMADDFVKYHLLNPDEFWTPMPLPSIAANDPLFRNNPHNDWSGHPFVMTYQRSIRALENYGHYAELSMLGTKYLNTMQCTMLFPMTFDPFNNCDKIAAKESKNCHWNMITLLEFISRMYGIHMAQDKIFWSCLDNNNEFNYSQEWGTKTFKLATKGNQVHCFIDGKEVFSFTKGIRVISDMNGKIIQIVGIEAKEMNSTIACDGKTYSLSVIPNSIYNYSNGFNKSKAVEFHMPGIY